MHHRLFHLLLHELFQIILGYQTQRILHNLCFGNPHTVHHQGAIHNHPVGIRISRIKHNKIRFQYFLGCSHLSLQISSQRGINLFVVIFVWIRIHALQNAFYLRVSLLSRNIA